MPEKTPNQRDALVLDECVSKLMEYFDHVQIFVSRDRALVNRIEKAAVGDGNYFARYGQVRQWVIEEESECGCGTTYDCKELGDDEDGEGDE